MKTNVQQSSLNVYHGEVVARKGIQADRIKAYMEGRGWVSGRQISEALGLVPGTVSARCKELEEAGELLRDEGLRKCPVSGRGVHMMRLAEEQLDMFGGVA